MRQTHSGEWVAVGPAAERLNIGPSLARTLAWEATVKEQRTNTAGYASQHQVIRKMKLVHSIMVLSTAISACACRADGAAPTGVSTTTEAAHTTKRNESDESTGTAPNVQFRHQLVAAASAIRPAVVSINSSETVEPRGDMSPYEGTPT